MFSPATAAPASMPVAHPLHAAPAATRGLAAERNVSEAIARTLRMLGEHLEPQRRLLHAGDKVHSAGDAFGMLTIVNSGFYKVVNLSSDGREQVVSLKFRGDWLGFDGIAGGCHGCDAVAMDTGEVWGFRYDALLAAASREPAILSVLHEAMSREISRDRDSLMSVCTLPAEARVADFLRYWAESMARHGMRADQVALRMTRGEIGNYLGLTLETVSRCLSRLARERLIRFVDKARRDVQIPDMQALTAFVHDRLAPAGALQ